MAPLGSISNWVYRAEYQQRGSRHIHILIWITDAPIFGTVDDEKVVSYFDKVITCSKPNGFSDLLNLVNRQTRDIHIGRCSKLLTDAGKIFIEIKFNAVNTITCKREVGVIGIHSRLRVQETIR